ncbi:unnamed protein product [Acanthoscelides obtectus]|uniref:Uncharacterized protein n=1 Tax=Acanthoscelides obtectus TaxID=200917 RepID=A0A9P0KJG3_ACAOB|nr:unnamed protein product [Acanthoscelides obtectus]CAK1625651.1 Octopamine receptor Oamb [Acanthoscelides obtectus]
MFVMLFFYWRIYRAAVRTTRAINQGFRTTKEGALSCIYKMKICLRYLGDHRYQQGIGQEPGVSQATVSETVYRVVNSIVA